jgi:hypothetical protein
MAAVSSGGVLVLFLAIACRPETSRPLFAPVSGAAQTKVDLPVPEATTLLADRLKADSIPVTRVEPRDGFFETPWFDTATGAATGARRLGAGVVRVRGWVDPTRVGHSNITIETLYRPLADPSLPERELDREVPPDHPTRKRVDALLQALTKEHGDTTGAP